MLTRPERLTSRQFDAAFGSSRPVRDGLVSLRVHWRADEAKDESRADAAHSDLRAAFAVPKKLGKAHWRNRTRRRIREAFRLQRADLQVLVDRAGSCDCIFMAQAKAHDAEFEALQISVKSLLARAVSERLKQRGLANSSATRSGDRASGAFEEL